MRNWRILTAVAAVVLAVIAGVLVWKYVDNADARAAKDKGLVEVLVAKSAIGRGTTGAVVVSEGLYTVKEFARESVPDGAIPPGDAKGRAARLAATLGARVSRDGISKDFPLVDQQFVKPSAVSGSFAGFIEKGKEAITLTVDDQHGVGGFISPGDSVNMLLSMDVKDLASPQAPTLKTTAFLLPGLKVLAVGQTTAVDAEVARTPAAGNDGTTTTTVPTAPVQRGLITVEVTPFQAEQIAHAYSLGGAGVYLTLNPANFEPGTFTSPQEIVEVANLFDHPLSKLAEVQAALRQTAGK